MLLQHIFTFFFFTLFSFSVRRSSSGSRIKSSRIWSKLLFVSIFPDRAFWKHNSVRRLSFSLKYLSRSVFKLGSVYKLKTLDEMFCRNKYLAFSNDSAFLPWCTRWASFYLTAHICILLYATVKRNLFLCIFCKVLETLAIERSSRGLWRRGGTSDTVRFSEGKTLGTAMLSSWFSSFWGNA